MASDTKSRKPALTPRLIQVGELVVVGATDAEIAQILNLSVSAVRKRVTRLIESTGANNRTGAAVNLLDRGIVETPAGRVSVSVKHVQVLTAALRRAEGQCEAVAGLADRFEAAYPAVSATASACDATLSKASRPLSESKGSA